MSACLACGAAAAAAEYGSPIPLAELLCLDHLREALEATPAPAPVRVAPDLRKRCYGLMVTCPRPVTRIFVNGRYCDTCEPIFPIREAVTRTADRPYVPPAETADTEMAEAVLAALAVGTIVRTHAHAYGPRELEGS